MTKFRITTTKEEQIDISADDMVLLPPFILFSLGGVPRLVINGDTVDCIENIQSGEWVGTAYEAMIMGE